MAKINYDDLTKQIVEYVGGIENIKTITHCVTRLRLYLNDRNKADDEKIKNLPGVLGVVYGNQQYQIILGESVFAVFDRLEKNYSLKTEAPIDENLDGDLVKDSSKRNFKYYFEKAITFMSQSLTPFITVVYGAGMLKVILSLLNYFFPAVASTTVYTMLNFMSSAPFYFMPVLVAYGTSKVLKANPAFSMAIALTLVYPAFDAIMTGGEAITMLGLPVHLATYGSTLLPGIFTAILCAYLEKFFYKVIPGLLRSVFAPLCVFLIGFPIVVLFLGPVGNVVGSWIVAGIIWLQAHVGGLAPGIIAAAQPFLVMMGVNMLPVGPMMELFARAGYDDVFRPGWILHNISEFGSCMAVALKTKDKEFRTTAISAGVGAMLSGVSEPALYGVNLRLKKPMISLVLGGIAGGAVAGTMGAKAFAMGYSSILGVVIFEKTMGAMLAGIAVSFVVSFVSTFILYDGKSIK